MDPEYREQLSKQSNLFIGEHTAVKVCGWTKKSLRNEGSCYKGKFYGINSHRCVQMSPAMNFCDHDCVFCWRSRSNSGFGKIDDPKELIDRSIDAQRKLLAGFGGNDKVDKKKFEESKKPMHFAISLNGEPTYYPRLSEFIKELNEKNMSSFLVTNGQLPNVLRKIEPPTQLYMSLDASNKEDYIEIDKPMRHDGWERILESLDVLRELRESGKTRTVIRVTLVKEMNDHHPEQWAELLERANPMFIEVKGYMFVGASRQRLSMKNMPYHEEVKEFANKIAEHCGYKVVDEQEISRVVLMMRDGEENAPWRYLEHPEDETVYERGDSEELPDFVDEMAQSSMDASCGKDELGVEQAEKLIKIK